MWPWQCQGHCLWLIVELGLSLLRLSNSGDVKPRPELYFPDYSKYHNLSQIKSHLEELVENNPGYFHLDKMYRSRNHHPQLLLRITNFTDSQAASVSDSAFHLPKVRILLSYGEHPREFLPIESLFHFLQNLTSSLTASPTDSSSHFARMILSRIDLFIVAMANPDGRQFVENTRNYCWRGTSTGVDLNRNFDWEFGKEGSSDIKEDEEYRGTHAFSEPECLVLIDLTAKYKFDAFISFHSGIRQIYVPFADTKSKSVKRLPNNLEKMMELAHMMSHSSVNSYTYGLAYQLNDYTADGTIFDFMAGVRNIPFSYAIELWGEGDHPGAQCFDLFNPTSQNLQTEVADIHPLYEVLFTYLIDWKREQVANSLDPYHQAPSLSFGFALLGFVILLTAFVALQSRLPPGWRLYPRRRIISLRSLSSSFTLIGMMKS